MIYVCYVIISQFGLNVHLNCSIMKLIQPSDEIQNLAIFCYSSVFFQMYILLAICDPAPTF